MMYFGRNVTRIQTGTRLPAETIAELVRTESPYLHRVLLKCGVHAPDVEDELQRVWETAGRHAKQVPGSTHGWLVRLAVNRAGNYHQRRRALKRQLATALDTVPDRNRHAEEESIEDQLCDRGPNPEQLLIAAEVARLVEQLDPELHAVTVACIAGETTKETSERLRIPEGTVISRLRRARTRIKLALARNNGQDR
jgi:RNA polymerase sigma-70 factor (ECF subfamily)